MKPKTLQDKRRAAGRKGGTATYQTHGKEHMQAIGRKGAASFWKRYRVVPIGTSDYALIKRITGRVIAFLSGHPASYHK